MICHQEWTNNLQVKQRSINNSNNLFSHHLHYLSNFLQSWLIVVQWVGPTILLDYLLLHHRMMDNLRNFSKMETLPHSISFNSHLHVECLFPWTLSIMTFIRLLSMLLCFKSDSIIVKVVPIALFMENNVIMFVQFIINYSAL